MTKVGILLLAGIILGGAEAFAQTSEEITITTYYPSPYGVYDDLEARDGFAVGDIATNGPFGVNSVDALDTGELWVEDSVIFRPLPNDPAGWIAGKTGELAYSADNDRHYYFDGTNWQTFGGGGNFIPIMPVSFFPTPSGVWTSLDLSSAIPVGTREVGGSLHILAPGGVAAFAIASDSAGRGEKDMFFQSDVSGYRLLSSFRLSLLENRKLYYQSTGLSSIEIKISEYK